MAINIKNPEVDRLATEVAHRLGTTKTEAVRLALSDRRDMLLRLAAEKAGPDAMQKLREMGPEAFLEYHNTFIKKPVEGKRTERGAKPKE